MGKPYKLSVRIGTNEFNGEGEEESVRADYQAFVERIPRAEGSERNRWLDALAGASDSGRVGYGVHTKKLILDNPTIAAWYVNNNILTAVQLDSLFELDINSREISLKKYSSVRKLDVADALLLLLFGFQMMLPEMIVKASDLTNAAHLSRFTFDRLDRAIAPHKARLIIDGETRGTKYSLNICGEATAIHIAKMVLEQECPGR